MVCAGFSLKSCWCDTGMRSNSLYSRLTLDVTRLQPPSWINSCADGGLAVAGFNLTAGK